MNDPNGTYTDRYSEADEIKAITLQGAREIMARQISESQDSRQ
jgi:hypothetical protein